MVVCIGAVDGCIVFCIDFALGIQAASIVVKECSAESRDKAKENKDSKVTLHFLSSLIDVISFGFFWLLGSQ